MWSMKKYKHLSIKERELIFLYHRQGKSKREIGQLLDRDHRTISRELLRNLGSEKKGGKQYSPFLAQALAEKRREDSKLAVKKLAEPVLRKWVIRKLGKQWSPETIAGRLKLKVPGLSVSYETIYQFIYAGENKRLRLWELLKRRHPRRQLAGLRRIKRKSLIPGRVFIEERPGEANLRLAIGHWETDNMEGPRDSKPCVSINVDRRSGVVRIGKLKNKEAKEKERSMIGQLGKFPERLVKSVTMDNGTENTNHQRIARRLGCQTYFCNPYHSWEKGSVENTIGLVRQYLPKGTDLAKITQGELSWIAWQLNHRPRKRLGYYTPSEVFEKETGWGI